MPLDEYRRKRDFARTPEPGERPGVQSAPDSKRGVRSAPETGPGVLEPGADPRVAPEPGQGSRRFVVGRHRASRLHYDLRLEVDGVLASWAVPRGPTLDPAARRMAVRVEDHPIEYLDFEDVIPAGQYGGGDAIVWDRGTYVPEATDDPAAALEAGELKFRLDGEKLRGRFTIVRTRGGDERQWLLIKKRDADAAPGWDPEAHPRSVLTGRTNEEVRAGSDGAPAPGRARSAAHGRATAPERGHERATLVPRPARIAPGVGRVAPMPDFIQPMAATLVSAPFSDPDWLFEVKWDGYRVQAHVRAGRLALRSKSGLDAEAWFPEAFDPPTWIDADEAILDGEVVALDQAGAPDFSLLQLLASHGTTAGRISSRRSRPDGGAVVSAGTMPPALAGAPLVYEVFDLLYLDGRLLLDVPLETRMETLRGVLRDHPRVRYSGSLVGDGRAFFDAAAGRGLEGIVAKHRRGTYEPGRRSRSWLKIKVRPEQEFVVVGYARGEGTLADLGSLLLAVRDDDIDDPPVYRYVGRVGSGIDARTRAALRGALDELRVDVPPVANASAAGPAGAAIRWSDPALVARVRFGGWTRDGMLRQASFTGMERDRDAGTVFRERPVHASVRDAPMPAEIGRLAPLSPTPLAEPRAAHVVPGTGATARLQFGDRTVHLTNLDRVLYPADGVTKRDLVRYYLDIAPAMLPHLAGRPLNLSRFPGGIDAPGFWQRELPRGAPPWLRTWLEPAPDAREAHTYVVAEDAATLAWLANSAAIEIHPWTSRIDAPECPTHALIDIDPGERTTFDEVLVLARLYRTALSHLGLRGYPKLTGKRGIQVFVPIRPVYTFDAVRDWVGDLSRAVGSTVPELVSWEWSVDRRKGLARLDYTQNAPNKTLVAVYSARAVPGAPVSAPIDWAELDDPALRPDRWTIRTLGVRLRERGDLFAGALTLDQSLPSL
jgi:bifunctional non-homologous end joining protein LigD